MGQGLSQPELATESGPEVEPIGNYEGGETSPDADQSLMVARALCIGAGELMGEGRTEPSIAANGGQLSDGSSRLPYVPDWDGTPVRDGHGLWPLPPGLKHGDRCLVMRVRDNAMHPFLMAGDAIIVDPGQARLRALETVVVRIGEEVLIRRFMVLKGLEIFLATQNSFDPIVVRSDHKVLARVIAVVSRNLRSSVSGPATWQLGRGGREQGSGATLHQW